MLNQLYNKIMKLLIMLKAFYLLLKEKKLEGQYTIYAMFMTVLTLIAYIVIHPTLTTIINDAGITGIEGQLISLAPLFIVLFILWTGVWYVAPHERH